MNQSEQVNELATALALANSQFKPILRDKTVKVRMKNGGEYTFAYAPLESIMSAVREALSSNGLTLSQYPCRVEEANLIETKLLHSSGQWIVNRIPVLVQDEGPQAYGSAITYARRYGVTTLLCLATDEDDDGNAASGNQAEQQQKAARGAFPAVPGTTPPPEIKVDTRKVNEYADRIKAAINAGNDGAIVDIMAEVKLAGNEFRVAVWATLPAPVKRALQDMAPRSV